MLTDSLKILSATPPPPAIPFRSGRHAYARIVQLETQLGLEPSRPIFNTIKADARIAELESLLAKKNTPAPGPVIPATLAASFPPAAPVAALPDDVLPLASYLKLSSADRYQFATDSGRLSLTDYNKLNATQKLQFIKDGGRIHEDRKPIKNSMYVGGQFQQS